MLVLSAWGPVSRAIYRPSYPAVKRRLDDAIKTRVDRTEVTEFLEEKAGACNLMLLGASGDRSARWQLVSPPTFDWLRDVECDVAVGSKDGSHSRSLRRVSTR